MSAEGKKDSARDQLRRLGEYLISAASGQQDVVDALANLTVPLHADRDHEQGSNDLPRLIQMAKREYAKRTKRERYFKRDLFGEAAWDILLDLFISKAIGSRVSVTSACIASHVPPTTALRWISLLEAEGLLFRTPDSKDNRRVWIEITDVAMIKMEKYFREISIVIDDALDFRNVKKALKNDDESNLIILRTNNE